MTTSDPEVHRYRLDVFAGSVVDVVTFVGGWLFDHALSGWDVTVYVPGAPDTRPLRILGASPGDLDVRLAADTSPCGSDSVLISADLYETDQRVRAAVAGARRGPAGGMALWGTPGHERQMRVGRRIRLSAAAVAFKAHALAAAHTGASGRTGCAHGNEEILYQLPVAVEHLWRVSPLPR